MAMLIRGREFDTKNRTFIMGILNVTPDSFSDGNALPDIDAVLRRVETMLEEGTDIIDVGGESTRPGFTPVSQEEELERIIPVIVRIRKNFDVPVSVDTYKPGVAKEALSAGADLINDIWGLKTPTGVYGLCEKDKGRMADVIAASGACCCIMHNKKDTGYIDLISEIKNELEDSVKIALDAGISAERIILDPGVGFAKSTEDNLKVLGRLGDFTSLGYPVLLGASRKSVIGNTLGLPVGERLEGTLATTAAAVMAGCSFVRVHDIRANRRFIDMLQRIKDSGTEA